MTRKLICILTILTIILQACNKDLESLNKNTKDATSANGETFFTSAQVNLSNRLYNVGLSQPPFVFFVQHITEVTYVELSNYFVGNTNGSDLFWRDLYQRVLKNLNESAKVISAKQAIGVSEEIKKKNQLGIIEIMTVFTYGILVDTYGDIPYSEALSIENVLPNYEDAKTVYINLIERISMALAELDASNGSFGNNDVIYKGDVEKWIKFGNSIKLKMGLRIADAESTLASQTVQESSKKVFSSNSDNAVIKYQTSTPNTHPLWVHLVQNNLRYYVGTNTIIDFMNRVNDPRRDAYFSKIDGVFKGGIPGAVQSFDISSHLSNRFYDPTLEAIFTDYASVEFLLAEAVERGIVSDIGSAEGHYNKGIRASFEYYGVHGVDDYLTQPEIAYSSSPGNWKQKIGTQKWVALFNQGFEAWSEYRRLDYPRLQAPPNAYISSVPVRMPYPVSEQSLNGSNFEGAANAIGGDLLTTKIFWDKN